MPISFNTGVSNGAHASATITLALPSGILVNDVMLMSLTCFNLVDTAPAIAFSGAGGNWTLVPTSDSSANPQVPSGGGAYAYVYAYYRIATAGDIGATLTITGSGAGFDSTNTWWAAAVASYTTVSTVTPVDVASGTLAFTARPLYLFSVTCPVLTPNFTSDMAVYLGGGVTNVGDGLNIPCVTTSRENIVSVDNVVAAITDSNGFAGYSAGGGQFSTYWQGITWLGAFTVGLTAADGGAAGPVLTGYRSG